MKSDTIKGYLFAFIATLAFSNVYIFSKAALNEIPLAQFGSLWYTVVAISCLLFAFFNKKLWQIGRLTKKQVTILFAGTKGFLDTLPVDSLAAYENELYDHIERSASDVFDTLRDEEAISDSLEARMKEVLTAFTEDFKQSKRL